MGKKDNRSTRKVNKRKGKEKLKNRIKRKKDQAKKRK